MSRYEGKLESAVLNGEGTFTVEEEGLSCSMLFDEEVISYQAIDTFRFENYSVYVTTAGKSYRFFHMGQQNEWMFQELYRTYNQKVLSTLLVTDTPLLSAEGICAYDGLKEHAKILVFPDCLCILPQGKAGRRYPFVFLNGLKREGYALTVTLSTGEECSFSMLGADLEPLERHITQRVRAIREEGRKFVADVCPNLSYGDTAAAAKHLQEGLAVPLTVLSDRLKTILLGKAKNSKIGPYYNKLLSLGDESRLAIGLKALDEETVEELKAALLEKLNANAEEEVTLTAEQEDALKWIVWAALPTADGQAAIVEFAFPNEDAATYLFRIEDNFESFLPKINRALEATKLGREVFSAPDAKVSGEMEMLMVRTPAIKQLRTCCLGKAVHRNPEAWAKSITALTAIKPRPQAAGCPQCGAAVEAGKKFCGICGAKLAVPTAGKCPSCGAQNKPNNRFCGDCGTKL